MPKQKDKVDYLKEVRGLGWDHISLSAKGFRGAVQLYQSSLDNKKVAVAFNLHEAFVIEDDAGLFGLEDIVKGVILDKEIDIENSGLIDGVGILASESGGLVDFTGGMAIYGLEDFSVKSSITTRLTMLSALDQSVDMDLG